jgi:hypothetical protein
MQKAIRTTCSQQTDLTCRLSDVTRGGADDARRLRLKLRFAAFERGMLSPVSAA